MANVLLDSVFTANAGDFVRTHGRMFRSTGAQSWQRLAIVGPDGFSRLPHWADPELAMAWLEFARRLVQYEDLWANNFAARTLFPVGDDAATMLQLALGALAQCCNALNVQWHCIPQLRKVYQRFFAGEPDGIPPHRAQLYGTADNYANGWWQGIDVGNWPIISQRSDKRGVLSNAAMDALRRLRNPPPSEQVRAVLPLDFVPRVVPFSLNRDAAEALTEFSADDVVNTIIVSGLRRSSWGDCRVVATGRPCEGGPGLFGGSTDSYDRAGLVRVVGDAVLLPIDSYLPFARELVAAMDFATERGTAPEKAILASRAYVATFNLNSAQANGGESAWLNALARKDASVLMEQTRQTPELRIALASLTALGEAFGGLGELAVGIASLVTGSIGAIASIADALIVKGVRDRGRDDLGRFKPLFERGWLSGNPLSEDVLQGAPTFAVPAPPSFDRSRAPRVGGTSGVTVERFVLPGGLGRITTGIPSKLREALGLVPDTLRPTSRATDEIAPLTGGPAPGTGPVPDTFTTGREGPGDTGIVTGGEGSWAPIPGVRAPVTVLVTNDSTGVTTRASWPSALAKRSQDGTQVRVYETGDATGATGARATVRAEEFCALNPGHPLCAGGATGGNGTSAGGTGAGSSRGSSSGIGTGAKVALGLLGVFLVVRALRARE